MEIKLIACDLDGTLLDSQGRLSPENLDAIRRMTDKAIALCPPAAGTGNKSPRRYSSFPASGI